MPPPTTKLTKAATCRGCYSGLDVGARVRIYRSKVYGMDCHGRGNRSREKFSQGAIRTSDTPEPVPWKIIAP